MIEAYAAGDPATALALHRELLPVFLGVFATQGVMMVKAVVALLLGACSSVATKPASLSVDSLIAAETAFAKSMADRDFDAFASHVDEGAVFINGGKPLRGKAAVLEHFKKCNSG